MVITTLQKFPFVVEKLAKMPKRRYAVIVDEAHSSQAGETAKELKLALGAGLGAGTDPGRGRGRRPGRLRQWTPSTKLWPRSVTARGRQPNISFFAFTATPKARTLENFGIWDGTEGRFVPFHLYSMRQAIEEGFILDVLQNYTTYKTFWKVTSTTRRRSRVPM